jgi:exopolyphosphatase/guanosine-5'-triphosphate,3'-diphosphate pyrophosphatase
MADRRPILDRRAPDRAGDGQIRAAIDLGTNSFHLVVARVEPDGHFDVLDREKEVVRLGSGAGEMRLLTPAAIERGLATLARFRRIADGFGATIDAVATSALREALNRDEFLRRARDEVGIDVDIVSGVEEARLIHLGVLHFVPLVAERILVIDIGGGSTELVVGQQADVLLARSLKLGAIRLTDRFFPAGEIRNKAVGECRTYVRSFLAPAVADLRGLAPFTAVGSSGTVLNLARIIAADESDSSAVSSGDTFTADGLRGALTKILARKRAADRADIVGLDEQRRDIIVAGGILLAEIVDLLSIERVVVSEAALREGILVDRVAAKNGAEVVHRLSDIRRRSVMRMAETFHENLDHIGQATDLALQLFDGLQPVHQLSAADRNLLEAAGLLHNVGLFVSHAAHHRHSYYVIRNTDQLVGFTDREVELIAQIARFHRKSEPKARHPEFEALSPLDQRRVRVLAGILRLGIALDRTRQRAVRTLTVRPRSDVRQAIDVDVLAAPGADVSLERYTAEQRIALLESALDLPVSLHFTSASARPMSPAADAVRMEE